MRPAVHASILRNRGPRRRMRMRKHVFSPRRLLMMVFCGVILFIPGLALTIVGLQQTEGANNELNEVQKIFYQAIGPAMCTLGAAIMFASCIYFYCYGTGPQPSPPPNNQTQGLSESEQDEKGSIRSKQRESMRHHPQSLNGRAGDVRTPDSESRKSLRGGEEGRGSFTKSPHRTSVTTEEEVPLAKMEDSLDITSKDQQLKVPVVTIHIHKPTEPEDIDLVHSGQCTEALDNQNDA
ncbi:uncharacterized protein LOC131930290 isoform X2 [Physella acuta]|uniref:uncharacterized protein LOC131930290 isoform X1 n=1 Tax=Physella acuta TaxID=109671 RepID=UPI0027DD0CA8|nr:uncharacterized protein LOC131930290 isoform X1 [Physella acuta]XP_059142691.1 uncharacterized protein LOC131930290 isoform X1 [Physella acuta]XP_059142692.1 uncharacterized protein LOC131930290 isoform X2 [Physella acuta]